MESTPIRIHNDTLELLNKAKTHPRETYDDIIKRLVKRNLSMEEMYEQSSKHCARCNKYLDFEAWMDGGQGYCRECFEIVCAEAMPKERKKQ